MLIAGLVPHAGAMVLLDSVLSWDAGGVRCRSRSHLDPGNPLRRAGRLHAICGIEYALQAAALHGALRDGGRAQRAGYVARLREVAVHVPHLDDPAHGSLAVHATLDHAEPSGMLYALWIGSEAGRPLVTGHAAIALRQPAGAPA